MGHTIILICAVIVIHTHTCTHQKYTDISQELTEWHLNMLPWHRACRHGNSIRGKSGLWDVPLGFFFMHFPFCQSLFDRQVVGGDCSLLLHTSNCGSAVLGLKEFRQLVFRSVHSYQHPPVWCWRLTSPACSAAARAAMQNESFFWLTNNTCSSARRTPKEMKGQYGQTHLIAVQTPAIIPPSHTRTTTHTHELLWNQWGSK